MYLNEGTLLNNLRRRYKKDRIYVSNPSMTIRVFRVFFLDVCGEHLTGDQPLQGTGGSVRAGNDEEIQRQIIGCDATARICYRYETVCTHSRSLH